MSNLVTTEALTKRFGDFTAVDQVDLSVEPGEVVGLLGANGAGKTTVIRMILGLERPTAGRVTLLGSTPSREGRARLGYVPQGLGLYDDLTVEENLAFVSQAFRTESPELGSDLSEIRNRPVGSISLGFRRRVAFAAALSHHPELLILDEPTSGVGPLGRAELWDAIGSAATDGAGVLVSTHYMEEAEQCDRLVMMASGRVVAEGSPTELTTGVDAIEIDTPMWRETLDALMTAGIQVSMAGGRVRAVATPPQQLESVLAAAGVSAATRVVSAGFEEAFVALSRR